MAQSDITHITIQNIKMPIQLRAHTSDIHTFRQVFIDKEYDFSMHTQPRLIIDGGANVGYVSVWYANKFLNAQIIAIEPEESNFIMLKKNTAFYPNIHTIQAGIWNKKGYLKMRDIGKGEWGFMVEEVNSKDLASCRAITIGDILKKSGHDKIDILKLDIEGAEKEVFSSNYEDWLDKVDILIIELHDRMKKGCSKAFYTTIKKYNFAKRFVNLFSIEGENIVFTKNTLL